MKSLHKPSRLAGYCALAVCCALLMAAGVNGIFNSVTSTQGYQVNGAAGTSGSVLCSDGTRYSTACSLYYQSIYDGSSSPMPQQSILAFSSDFAVANVLGPPGKTSVNLANVGTAGTYTNPSSVTTNARGQITAITSGPAFTGTSGYQVLPSGLIIEWALSAHVAAGTRGAQSVSFPLTFPNGLLSVSTSIVLDAANSTSNWQGLAVYVQPVGTSVAGCSTATGLTGACLYFDSRSDSTPDTGVYGRVVAIGY